ncbi:hypothetical protein [Sphingopyxis alaskensis]|uniref:hypothetical protein n=1 Tax=Sphingopyxis alaskensis TaxID=117207 RepID=UPI00203E7131|nr:hypothetical protein [Sphingopyxis alaskensis]MCM3420863.1 hypothetical protein [Sphingopyxis alaskensis]
MMIVGVFGAGLRGFLPNKTLFALCSASHAHRIGLGSFTGCGKSAFSLKLPVALKLTAKVISGMTTFPYLHSESWQAGFGPVAVESHAKQSDR